MGKQAHEGTLIYVDNDEGFGLIRSKFGNLVVDIAQLRRAGIKWKTAIPDIPIRFHLLEAEKFLTLSSIEKVVQTPKKDSAARKPVGKSVWR